MTREIPCQPDIEGVGRRNRFLVEQVGADTFIERDSWEMTGSTDRAERHAPIRQLVGHW